MSSRSFVILAVTAIVLLLAGCASAPERELSKKSPTYAALPNGYDPLHPTQFSSMYAASTDGSGENVIRYLERRHGRPLNVLSLSGGGQNGAFGAGFLIGWRERGGRPAFDIVGGVSTGALLATHAFLGTPADDVILEEMYTKVAKEDIYVDFGFLNILSGTNSLKDTAPLRALIAKYITEETLRRVAAASGQSRVLAVSTTNIDYGETWVWNMGMIAKAGDLELYHKVLLASCS
ncbi:MAG: patatin-like phospholipase family protein, partial [Kiloniellales bacterium]|nr:patatin-like phospholipase family protein [Kiloniellales bacterium]